jgi:hypothetical protein
VCGAYNISYRLTWNRLCASIRGNKAVSLPILDIVRILRMALNRRAWVNSDVGSVLICQR